MSFSTPCGTVAQNTLTGSCDSRYERNLVDQKPVIGRDLKRGECVAPSGLLRELRPSSNLVRSIRHVLKSGVVSHQ